MSEKGKFEKEDMRNREKKSVNYKRGKPSELFFM